MELKEAKKIINDFIKAMKPVFIVVNNDEINANLKKVEIEALETVLQALEELQKENEKYISGELMSRNQAKHFEDVTKKYYIHKDKIKEKIEELKSDEEKLKQDEDYVPIYQIKSKIKVLQELLKGE